jgi:DNA-binding response OmpR family regulator
MLPDSDGIDICRKIRGMPELAHVPVILLTARVSESDRILGLEAGANDYVTKPFFVRESIARVLAQLRRKEQSSRVIRIGGILLDRDGCRAQVAGIDVELTATEFRLLEHLMLRPGIVFSRQHLLDAVWGHERAITERSVDVYVLRLRQKIEGSGQVYIRSVRGFGYAFESDPLDQGEAPRFPDTSAQSRTLIVPRQLTDPQPQGTGSTSLSKL